MNDLRDSPPPQTAYFAGPLLAPVLASTSARAIYAQVVRVLSDVVRERGIVLNYQQTCDGFGPPDPERAADIVRHFVLGTLLPAGSVVVFLDENGPEAGTVLGLIDRKPVACIVSRPRAMRTDPLVFAQVQKQPHSRIITFDPTNPRWLDDLMDDLNQFFEAIA
ncbi:hypothetical protein KBD34_02665 [Patescibacteria group bacterium]|nr:hypothetical protein [Patescibacteria group bacterium]